MKSYSMKNLLFVIALSFTSTLGFAAKIDPDFAQPLHLSGDFLGLNLNSHNGIYKGNFVATQGSMKLEGHEIQLKQKSNQQLDSIIVFGQPVKFQKKNYRTGELIKGQAEKITYDANRLLVKLEGNAEMTSNFNKSIKSAVITYGLSTGEIEAIGNAARRVHIVIPANSSAQSSPIR